MPLLRNKVIDILADQRESGWPLFSSSFERIEHAFAHLPEGAKLLRYIVNEAAWCWDRDLEEIDNLPDLPHEFVTGVMSDYLRHVKKPIKEHKGRLYPWWRWDSCALHDHPSDEEKEKCKQSKKAWQQRLHDKDEAMEPVRD